MKRLDKIDRIEDVEIERPNIKINFRVDKTPGRVLATLKHATKKFGALTIVENASAEIDRGDKIALIGANGKGKSTLLRMIAGAEPFSGERIWGHNVEESFYAQHQMEALDVNNTLLEEMQLCGSQKTDLELRVLLGCFLFSGDDVDKKIKVLSGGEKARVALAKTIVSKANFLLLDEPTNHLDMHSCDLLIEALNRYEGSLLLVSHDRYFISKTANKIWEIDEHQIREFKGTYEEWVDWKERNLAAKQLAQTSPVPPKAQPPAASMPKTAPPAAAPAPAALRRLIRLRRLLRPESTSQLPSTGKQRKSCSVSNGFSRNWNKKLPPFPAKRIDWKHLWRILPRILIKTSLSQRKQNTRKPVMSWGRPTASTNRSLKRSSSWKRRFDPDGRCENNYE
jgi:ATP-binding cassette subfamily F protein 3